MSDSQRVTLRAIKTYLNKFSNYLVKEQDVVKDLKLSREDIKTADDYKIKVRKGAFHEIYWGNKKLIKELKQLSETSS